MVINPFAVETYKQASIEEFPEKFHTFIRTKVPKILKDESSWDVGAVLKPDVSAELVNHVGWWLFENDPEHVLQEIEQQPQNICGRVFKPGEPVYSCRECSMDSTCVLCQACFKNSEHKQHLYKLHTSSGGGCCDCGDVEAWKNHHSCALHDKEILQKAAKLPEVVKQRSNMFFRTILNYVAEVSLIDNLSMKNVDRRNYSSNEGKFLAVLFNDESHTFNYVIRVLKLAIGCNDEKAGNIATLVDREGRCVIKMSTKEQCEKVRNVIMVENLERDNIRAKSPLLTVVMEVATYAHQEFALLLLSWISNLVRQSTEIRDMFSNIALQKFIPYISTITGEELTLSFAEVMIMNDSDLWITARTLYHMLLMNSLLLNPESKKQFAVLYTKLYGRIQQDFILDDHDHSQSISSMSVQLFTAPSLAQALVMEERVIHIIADMIRISLVDGDSISASDTHWYRIGKLDLSKMKELFRRLQYCFFDLKYILANVPATFNDKLREGFRDGFRSILTMLLPLQGMNGVVRKTDRHIEQEPDWESGITIQTKLSKILRYAMQWCAGDEALLKMCLEDCVTAILHVKSHNKDLLNVSPVSYNNREYPCIDYDITKQEVSMFTPIPRLMGALLTLVSSFDRSLDEVDAGLFQQMSIMGMCLELMEYALRPICLAAQVHVGIWRRNGYALINQAYYYKNFRCRAEMFDRDLQILQICAGNIDPDHFMTCLLNKINLINTSKPISEVEGPLIEEVLGILISIFCERFQVGIGEVTERDTIRRELIHILAGGEKPHSKIIKQLSEEITDKLDWEDVLHEVSEFKGPSSANTVGKYSLKLSCLNEFCPFYFHYNDSGADTAAQSGIRKMMKDNNISPVFKASKLPKFKKMLENVPQVLCCDSFITFLRNNIKMIRPEEVGKTTGWTDKFVDMLLYLINIAVNEEQQQKEMDANTSFNFIYKFTTGGVFDLLRNLSTSPCVAVHKETFQYIISEIDKLSNTSPLFGLFNAVPGSLSAAVLINSDRKRKADERRKKLLIKMKSQQKNFLMQNPDLLQSSASSSDLKMSTESPGTSEVNQNTIPVCMSQAWQKLYLKDDEPDVCILCQEESSNSNGLMVTPTYVQRSSIYCRPDSTTTTNIDFKDLSFPVSMHISSCNHVLHETCFQTYYEQMQSRAQRNVTRRFFYSFNPDKEFLCPLCRRLSNSVIPVINHTMAYKSRNIDTSENEGSTVDAISDEIPLHQWVESMIETNKKMGQKQQDIVVENSNETVTTPLGLLGDITMHEDITDLRHPEAMETQDAEPLASLYKCIEKFDKKCMEIQGQDSSLNLPIDVGVVSLVTGIMALEGVNRIEDHSLTDGPIRMFSALVYWQRAMVVAEEKNYKTSESEVGFLHEDLCSLFFGEKDSTVLLSNMFTVLVQFFNHGIPSRLKQKTSTMHFEKHLLHICTIAQLVQVILQLDYKELKSNCDDEMEFSTENSSEEISLAKKIFSFVGGDIPEGIPHHKLIAAIKMSMLPYLRWCSLYLHLVTKVPPPDAKFNIASYDILMAYLGLPKTFAGLVDPKLEPLITRWCQNPEFHDKRLKDLPKTLRYPAACEVPNLVNLPHDYSDLLEEVADFSCPKFDSEDLLCPTMCLVCRKVVCSQNFCCQEVINGKTVGACNAHSHRCGRGVGLFLRIRECSCILLDSPKRGTYASAPYLDKYGEADKGLRRGNPLYLNKHQLHMVRKLWLSHSIPEQVSHDIESRETYYLDWAHL